MALAETFPRLFQSFVRAQSRSLGVQARYFLVRRVCHHAKIKISPPPPAIISYASSSLTRVTRLSSSASGYNGLVYQTLICAMSWLYTRPPCRIPLQSSNWKPTMYGNGNVTSYSSLSTLSCSRALRSRFRPSSKPCCTPPVTPRIHHIVISLIAWPTFPSFI